MRSGKTNSYGMLILFLITGAVLGGILGELILRSDLLGGVAPYLVRHFVILDVPPVTVNLYVVKLILGLTLQPNLISILGMVLAVVLFRNF